VPTVYNQKQQKKGWPATAGPWGPPRPWWPPRAVVVATARPWQFLPCKIKAPTRRKRWGKVLRAGKPKKKKRRGEKCVHKLGK